jgi:hypothetical protein
MRRATRRMQDLSAYIEANAAEPLSLEHLAGRVHPSAARCLCRQSDRRNDRGARERRRSRR